MTLSLGVRLFLLAALQGTLTPALSVGGVAPDLLLTSAILLGMSRDPTEGAVLGWMLGFVQGTLHGDSLGSFLVSRTLAGGLAGALRPAISHDHPLAPSLCVLALTFATELLWFLMTPLPFRAWLTETILVSLLNAVMAVPLHFALTVFARDPRGNQEYRDSGEAGYAINR